MPYNIYAIHLVQTDKIKQRSKRMRFLIKLTFDLSPAKNPTGCLSTVRKDVSKAILV